MCSLVVSTLGSNAAGQEFEPCLPSPPPSSIKKQQQHLFDTSKAGHLLLVRRNPNTRCVITGVDKAQSTSYNTHTHTQNNLAVASCHWCCQSQEYVLPPCIHSTHSSTAGHTCRDTLSDVCPLYAAPVQNTCVPLWLTACEK